MRKLMTIALMLTTTLLLAQEGAKEVDLGELLKNPVAFLNQEITTTGTVDHVCKHGGKKMVIFAATPEDSIHVMASDAVPVFNAELNGSDVWVHGVMEEERITKAEILKMIEEREAAAAKGNAKPSGEKGEGYGHGEGPGAGHDDHEGEHKDPAAGLKATIKKMEAEGKEYLSSFHITCKAYRAK
jgi:hypothetical protein